MDLLPYAIEYGMSVEDFWVKDPDLFWAYRFSYINKYKREQENFNERAWLQGAYFYEAISVAISNAFGKEISYSKEPYNLKPKQQEKTENKNQLSALDLQLKQRAEKIKELLGSDKKNEQ